MKRRLAFCFLCVGLLATAIAPVAAGEGRRYVVGVEELDYYPAYAARQGEYVGAAREILDAFAADHGLSFSYQPMPIARLTAELVAGGIDFKFPDNAQWSAELRRGRTIAYSKAVIAYVDGVMVLPERKGRGQAGFATLGTVTGFTPYAWLPLLGEGKVRLVENPQMRALQRQVLGGRIDGAYASIAVANHILETDLKQPGALVFDPDLPHVRSDYYLSSARHPELIRRFNLWLETNAARIQAIKARYGAEKGVR